MISNKFSIFFVLFFLSFFVYSIYLFFIVKFVLLPLILIILGFLCSIVFKKNSILVFLFFLPIIGSLPSFFKIGYPHNYIATPIFFFFGIFIYFYFNKKFVFNRIKEPWFDYYKYFLIIALISTIFVFLRWSNFNLSLMAIFKDLPVSPNNLRLSFAAIFPLLSLLLFSSMPIFYNLLVDFNLKKERLLIFTIYGYLFSLLIALIQKYVNPYFFVARFGESDWYKYQQNGGFSDQNSFAFVSGLLLLTTLYFILKNNKKFLLSLPLFILGGILSGAKVFFLFVIFALFIIVFSNINKTQKIKTLIFLIVSFAILLLLFNSVFTKRVGKSLNQIKSVITERKNIDTKVLNSALNGRFEMIENSVKILKRFPVEGIGVGNYLFYLEYLNFGKDHLHDLTLNEYLRIMDETGIIGIILFLVFLLSFLKILNKTEKLLFLSILIVIGLNNYFWFSESFFIFWFFLFVLDKEKDVGKTKLGKKVFILFVSLFLLFNVLDYKKLLPLNLSLEKAQIYDFGFWKEEIDNNQNRFRWTKDTAGIYIDKKMKKNIKIFCGAPLKSLPNKSQRVVFYFNNTKIKDIIFKTNKFEEVRIPKKQGFLVIKVFPTFNLKKLNIGSDSRDLGVRFYYDFTSTNNKKSELAVKNFTKLNLFQGEKLVLKLLVKNFSKESISSKNGYFFSYHLKREDGSIIKNENRRFEIKAQIKSGDIKTIEIPIYIDYKEPGKYRIKFDIVKEGFFWLSSKSWKLPELELNLKSLYNETFKNRFLNSYFIHNNELINKEQYLLRLILKNNEAYKNKRIYGFSPGTDYKQFWIRDIATYFYYAKLFYPLKTLKNNIVKFLELQKDTGEICDWFDFEGNTDKNTVETDQESSLIIAAFELFKSDPIWIKSLINNRTIISKLESALDFVWKFKRNKKYDLIESGLTADWGDVENTYPDQRATKLSKNSTMVFSIYTQSKYIQACEKIIEMFKYINKPNKVKKWLNRKKILMTNSRKYLFNQKKGYFLIHYYPTKKNYYDIESNIFALGGNSEAILSGLMKRDEIKRLISFVKFKIERLKLKSISYSLLPPYPSGFFKHPLMKEWMYQNGGAWDWIGLRYIKALFKYGFYNDANFYTLSLIKKHLSNFNIFEWEDRNGVGRGADFYTGAAGIMGEILYKYYLNFDEEVRFYKINLNNNSSFIKLKIDRDEIVINKKKKNSVIVKKIFSGKKLLING